MPRMAVERERELIMAKRLHFGTSILCPHLDSLLAHAKEMYWTFPGSTKVYTTSELSWLARLKRINFRIVG